MEEKIWGLPAAAGAVSLTLEIPLEQMLIIDYDKWGYRINCWYIPLDAADEASYNQQLKLYGIANEAQLILTDKGNYYPQLRQKIIHSWERLFTAPAADIERNVGVAWILRREWVKEVQVYESDS